MHRLPLVGLFSLCWSFTLAQDAKPTPAGSAAAPEILKITFDDLAEGKPPADMMVVDGEFAIKKQAAANVLAMLPEPLTDGAVLLGKSMKFGGTVTAKVMATSVKRRHPKFGIGSGGTSGFKLRIVGAEKLLELAKGDERVATVEATGWKSGAWTWLELSCNKQADGKWLIEGRTWGEKETRPEKPTLSHVSDAAPPTGKAAMMAAPFSGTEILFDDVTIAPLAEVKP